MRFLVASDSYKGSLSSLQVGNAIKNGILKANSEAFVEVVEIADGGEGTVSALLKANDCERIQIVVQSPLNVPVHATYTAFKHKNRDYLFIECAQSTGLNIVPSHLRNPMKLNSYGLGEQIKDAICNGHRSIVISLGGSATNDAGTGMLQALGWRFFDQQGKEVGKLGNPLMDAYELDDSGVIQELKECTFTVASDVKNPFFGENGAAYVFGRQKGASPEQIELLDDAMRRFAVLIQRHYGRDVQKVQGAGAAGGLGGALVGCLGAEMASGIDVIMDMIGLENKIKESDFVITGEGSLDDQSIMGKVPVGVAKLAQKHNKPVIGIAGRIDTRLNEINQYLNAVFSIQTECRTLQDAMAYKTATTQLQVTAEQITRLLSLHKG